MSSEMAEAGPIWERFIAHPQTFQTSQPSGVLGARSLNLSSSSIGLSPKSAALMREITVRPVSELLSQAALRELARRSRLVDYIGCLLRNRTKDATTEHGRVQAIAVAGIEVRFNAATWLLAYTLAFPRRAQNAFVSEVSEVMFQVFGRRGVYTSGRIRTVARGRKSCREPTLEQVRSTNCMPFTFARQFTFATRSRHTLGWVMCRARLLYW